MVAKGRDLRIEVATLAVVVAAACVLSCNNWRKNRLVSWLLSFGTSFDNIYQLIPILQKNSKALFLVFNDIASSINSVAAAHNGETPLSKDAVRAILDQEWVQIKLRNVQDSVLEEFGVDAATLDEAINRFKSDDQVQMYINGVEMMYNAVLDGGYPRCPGVEHYEGVTKAFVLSVISKVVKAKQLLLKESKGSVTLPESTEVDIIYREMQRFGCTNPLDAFIAFKNTENCYQYDFEFVQARQKLYLGYDHSDVSEVATSDADIPRVSAEELELMLETMEAEVPLYLLVSESNHLPLGFVSFIRDRSKMEPKAAFAWMPLAECPQTYKCKAYPAAIRFVGGVPKDTIVDIGR
ncbi:hypothetical protein BBOV_I002900 [Babesia bovis T2Bo]|uniref:Uncharacterized protein n=1 Tax=Babesia bovis TaxID=5865 RepID=A7AWE4_BABBO|nr:hypothetical protein BBOV_I002900 [Babesia bovis T2Bo]EDO05372.1 hypothetical protein BBOV_I002900 [Babesia bovis T2Bo]BAN64998.1 hypothetical protein [Babesia bovis]|eukprot:XP_001608940.1 hypothetical protein [Babesia bovis T2Bo]